MKILFFILGSIKSRIVDWGIDNMNELLMQDVVFFGPIAEENFALNGKNYLLLPFNDVIGINDLFERLPDNWIPDVVSCDVSVLNFVPDIYKCPVKTYLMGRDGWGDISFNRGICELFDFLNYGIIDRAEYEKYQTKLLPLSGMPVSIPKDVVDLPLFSERSTDVISIANYNSAFYHDRYKMLFNFANFGHDKYKIKYLIDINRDEIHDYYRNSKVVLDWAHTLSNRSYEAAINGCLLFSHEDNELMKQFWEPFAEYVPYNENNINSLMDYYLSNPDASQMIINNMREKISRIPNTFGGAIVHDLKIIHSTSVNIFDRIKRIENLDSSTFYHRISTGFYFYYFYKLNFQPNWHDEYFKRIDQAISTNGMEINKIIPLIEAARFSYLIGKYEAAHKYLNLLIKILPDYAWLYFMKAKICIKNSDVDQAIMNVNKSIRCCQSSKDLLDIYPLPFVEHGVIEDYRRIVSYLWNGNHKADYGSQYNYFICSAYDFLGEMYETKLKDTVTAIKYYKTAISQQQSIPSVIKLCRLLFVTNQAKEINFYTFEVIKDSPYDFKLAYYHYLGLISTGQYPKAAKTLREYRMTLRPFKRNRTISMVRFALFVLTFLTFMHFSLPHKLFDHLLTKN